MTNTTNNTTRKANDRMIWGRTQTTPRPVPTELDAIRRRNLMLAFGMKVR